MPRIVFPDNEIERAFRQMQLEPNLGKILIQLRVEDSCTINSPQRTILATPKLVFDRYKSYIIIGGTSLFSLEIADWMIRNGARNIIINFYKESTVGYHLLCLRKWSMYDAVEVRFDYNDASKIEGSQKLLSIGQSFGPVGGKQQRVILFCAFDLSFYCVYSC